MITEHQCCECEKAAVYFVSPDTNRRIKAGFCSRCYEIKAFRYNQVNHSVANRPEAAGDKRRRGRLNNVNGGTGFMRVYPDAEVVLAAW